MKSLSQKEFTLWEDDFRVQVPEIKKEPHQNSFQPSSYQQDVFDFIQHDRGHLVVKASAGSGKSTTLVQASLLLPSQSKTLFCAFNTHIQKELKTKLKESGSRMECSTIHSLGYRILSKSLSSGKIRLEEKKYRELCRSHLLANNYDSLSLVDQFQKMVDFTRLTLVNPTLENLTEMINHYELDIDVDDPAWPTMWRGVSSVLAEGVDIYKKTGILDFTDMVYLPNVIDATYIQYDYLFVDECQDLNAAQLELVVKCLKKDGRFVFVGDESQAIQGFAGADNNSMDHIISRTQAHTLPLSICYRCPTSHVELASQICLDIEPSPFVDEGVIEVIPEHQFITTVQPGDLVLCRTTAPLVENCLKLLREGIKAEVRGQDIGKNFIDLLRRMRKQRGFSFTRLQEEVMRYRTEQIKTLSNTPDSEMKIASLGDKMDTLLTLFDAYLDIKDGEATFTDFEQYLNRFFSDDEQSDPAVMFSTIHKAKGLESPCVFILRPDLLPHPAAKREWQKEQELNIEYVALTRAKWDKDKPEDSGLLFFVGGMPDNLRIPVRRTREDDLNNAIRSKNDVIEEQHPPLQNPDVDKLQRYYKALQKKEVFWSLPLNGYRNGYISPDECLQRLSSIYTSGNALWIMDADDFIQKVVA